MANKRKVLSNYTKKNLPKYKQEYAEINGSLVGFTKSKQYKRFKRNKRSAGYRFNEKVKAEGIVKIIERDLSVKEVEKTVIIWNGQETVTTEHFITPGGKKIKDFKIIEENQPFFSVFSYDEKNEKAAIAEFDILKDIQKGAIAVIDAREIGLGYGDYKSPSDYQKAIIKVFKACRVQQTEKKTYPMVTIAWCNIDGIETIIIRITAESTWRQPKKQ